jgi:hypothetical protein
MTVEQHFDTDKTLDPHTSVHRNIITDYSQQDATILVHLFL